MRPRTRLALVLLSNVPVLPLLLAVAPRSWVVVRVGGVRLAVFASRTP
jgi:hypothetical protein